MLVEHIGVLLLALIAPSLAQVACPAIYTECGSPCPSGFKLDAAGCKTCDCLVASEECPLMKCVSMSCPYGYAKDTRGCRTCTCAETTDKSICPEFHVACSMFCELGFKKDSLGCEICACSETPQSSVEPACPTRFCKKYCENGYQKDSKGCSVCLCVDSPSAQVQSVDGQPQTLGVCPDPAPTCLMQCELGFQKDSTGCSSCTCVDPPSCPELQVACTMYCPQGYKRDSTGCQTCVCLESSVQNVCSSTRSCKKYCVNGFKKDSNGCDICQCNNGLDSNCPHVTCMMYCENGFKKDAKGCQQCSCSEVRQTQLQVQCPPANCKMFCETGFRKDGNGCDLCQCNDQVLCPTCAIYCQFGFVRDAQTGCDACTCLPNPCHNYYCEVEKRCVVEADSDDIGRGIYIPACISGRRWCPDKPAFCVMHCENGFQTDKSGCNVCKCKTMLVPPEDCPVAQCDLSVVCKFGYSYNEDGCRICQCLMNPCLEKKCSTGNVCEAYKHKDCPHCPRTAQCIGRSDVQHIEIAMHYIHSNVKDLDENEFKNEFTESMSKLLGGMDDDTIEGIKVERISDGITGVEFQLISNSDPVTAYETMLSKVQKNEAECAFEVNDVKFYPDPVTVTASYYSQRQHEEVEPVDDGIDEKMIIIICTVVGACVLVVISIIIVACVCSKKKHNSKENIIYKQTPKSDRI